MTARLYLSDPESRRAGEGSLLVVRPASCQPLRWQEQWICGSDTVSDAALSERMQRGAPWAAGNVLPAREAWACSRDFNGQPVAGLLAECDSIWYRATIEPLESAGIVTPMQAAHGHWRPAPQMPAHAVRHRLRVVKVECRPVNSVTIDEVGAAGVKIPVFPIEGRTDVVSPAVTITGLYNSPHKYFPPGLAKNFEEVDYYRAYFASEWDGRYHRAAPWKGMPWAWFVTCEAAP